MRSQPNDKTGIVKRFSYKGTNESDDQRGYQKGLSSVDNQLRSILGSSDMDVIRSVRKDGNNSSHRDNKLRTISPPLMTGFYSRYTSQDPRRHESQLGGEGKDPVRGRHGGALGSSPLSYMGVGKPGYSYSQAKQQQQRTLEAFAAPEPTLRQTATQKKTSYREPLYKSSFGYHDAGSFDSPSPGSDKERGSADSWDDFF